MRDADGVADRDLEDAEVRQPRGDVGDLPRSDRAFERTAERGREIAAHAQAGGERALADRPVGRQRLVDALVDVLPAERFGRRGEDRDLGDAGGDRAVEARRGSARAPCSGCPGARVMPAKTSRGVRHLRHPFRADERRHLDHRQVRGGQAVDELDLVGRRHQRLLVLQAVARADFDDGDAAWPCGRHARTPPAWRPPGRARPRGSGRPRPRRRRARGAAAPSSSPRARRRCRLSSPRRRA